MNEKNGPIGEIDAISNNPRDGYVELHIIDDTDWSHGDAKLESIVAKINLYITFVFGGQIDSYPEYARRPIRFVLHCRDDPPHHACLTFLRIQRHLLEQEVDFCVTLGGDINNKIDLGALAQPE